MAVVTSIVPGLLSCWYVSGVPQRGQNVRTTGVDDRKNVGSPDTKVKAVAGTTIQATEGAPAARLQERQWQMLCASGKPVIR